MQCMATSRDGLRTWRKRPEPVIKAPPEGMKVTGFRDPVVWREGSGWKMTVGSGEAAVGPAVLLYRSNDLENWTYMGPLYQPHVTPFATPIGVADGMMWECPDFFELDGKHVLITSGRGTHYMIGSYDGAHFQPERSGLLDFGESYAPRTMKDADGNRILWAWILERRSPGDIAAAGWSGVMSLPRQLNIAPDGDLAIRPSAVIDTLRRGRLTARGDTLAAALQDWKLMELCGEVVVRARNSFAMQLLGPTGEHHADVGYDVDHEQLIAGPHRPTLRLGPERTVTIRLLVDGSVVEVYANDRVCVSLRAYPKMPGPLSVVVQSRDLPAIEQIDLWQLDPVSSDRMTR
jgi:beta-fructofuranosidase